MLKFFRKIRRKLLAEHKISGYLKYGAGEILLVVIGILIALSINNWNEGRKARAQELSTMKEIIENLNYDILRCQRNSSKNAERLIGLDSLRIAVSNTIEGIDETTSIYYFALKYGQDFSRVTLNRSAFDQLINSETIQLLDNRQLVQDLSDYYQRKSFAVFEFDPGTGLINLKAMHRKFLQFRGLDDYIESFDSIGDTSFEPDYEYNDLLQMKQLELLRPEGLKLDDYLNEIAQFQIDLKNYNFYVSWVRVAAEKLIEDIEKEYRLNQD